MHSTFKIGDPSKLPATLAITAPVGDFIALANQLDSMRSEEWDAWPLSGIRRSIEEIIGAVSKQFYSIQMPEQQPRDRDTDGK